MHGCLLGAAGGELSSTEEITSDAYLRKWLVAREWDVALSFSCIVSHAGWRAHIMPHGYIDEVRQQVGMLTHLSCKQLADC
jgi:hypothetical protein